MIRTTGAAYRSRCSTAPASYPLQASRRRQCRVRISRFDGNVEQTFLIELVQTTTGLNLEQVQDAVAALLAEGDNVTLTYDDAAGTLTIAASGGGAGDGTDQTARDAALAAQQAADTAQGAADTAQGEIDTHEASTHNTDQTARNRGATARTEAQEAQTTVDDHIANHPGNGGGNGTPHTEQRVLQQDPMGSAATLGKFQIDPTGNAYGTVPDTELGVLATGDFTVFNHADYAGELDFEPNAQSFPLGEHYFLIVDHKLRVTIASTAYPGTNEWADGDWSDLLAGRKVSRGARQRCRGIAPCSS